MVWSLEHHGRDGSCTRCVVLGGQLICRRCLSLTLASTGWFLAFAVTSSSSAWWIALLPIATAADWASSWRASGRYDARLVWASSSITGAAVGTALIHLALGDWWTPATPWVAGVAILIAGSKLRTKIKARPAQDR